ncbi:amidohydrolase family protein [Halomonas urumqiensis]|uniref:Amidohydrolase n=1 Tax=Halomonas urumqiensis TaxID=1684789 RepID=A0A2N7UHK2_9GAMM|nr:amidohydrolase family protein [Halomonas urumqiensis]PMR79919.1 amidohydrolase [Halomonas urumqiensis]PTB02056.1 amidohydrolase [Halomonas urumqiensis]GHE21495.1 D-galactarolactone isomerase [Halomonas urumqiensis]
MSTLPDNTRPLDGPAPHLEAPAGATDCHIHLYLPGHAAQAGGPPIAELATCEHYRRVQRRLGLERVVVTQSNAYQRDNGALLEALDQLGTRIARGVAAVGPDVTDACLDDWHARGVRGARIMNLPCGAYTHRDMAAIERRIRPYGWHLMVQFNGVHLDDYLDGLLQLEGDYIIDHIGKFMPPVAADDRRVDEILRLLDRGNAWFKICGAYEASEAGAPWDDVGAIARRVIRHAPERILWGSNWPHVGVTRDAYPDDAAQLDVLLEWASPEARKKILVDNPAALYGF